MDAKEIKATFERYGVEVVKEDFWQVQGTWVVKHKALERLAGRLGIQFDDPKMMVQSENELVMFVRGHVERDGRVFSEWSMGEILTDCEGANYRPKGKQPSYKWAMLEKRVKDRVILKLSGLHGLYSEDEADEFKNSATSSADVDVSQKPARAKAEDPAKPMKLAVVKPDEAEPMPDYNHLDGEQRAVCDRVLGIEEIAQVSDYMMSPEVQAILNGADQANRTFIRTFAGKRLKALGWLGAGKAKPNADA